MTQQYDLIANQYENLIPEPLHFLEYYKKSARENIQILDIGCGTGRLAIELSKQGANVDAIDISSRMIEIAELKLNDFPKLKEKLNFRATDILNFQSNKKYDVIIMSGGVFEYLLSPEEQKANLLKIRSFLKVNGSFIMDLISPPQVCKYSERSKDGEIPINKAKTKEIKSWNKIKYDYFNQIVQTECFFEINNYNEPIKQYSYKFLTRYTSLIEMKYLFELCGFVINNFYGDYDQSIFKKGSEFMIFETKIKENIDE